MSTRPLAISGSGMVCAVGLSAPSACAAIRCGIDNAQETRFIDSGGEWIMGSRVPIEQSRRGAFRLIKMVTCALQECVASDPMLKLEQVPVLFCLAEEDRPGRLDDLNNQVFSGVQKELGIRLHDKSECFSQGRVSIAAAMQRARKLIFENGLGQVIIAGVDSLLVGATLKSFEECGRLLTSQNSNGFVPGEAAAAILVEAPDGRAGLTCIGIGFGREKATISNAEIPLRADGMVEAIHGALDEAGCNLGITDFRITDISGEQYAFKEATLALLRVLRQRKEFYDIWHPADCVGEVGAAIGPIMLAVLLAAGKKSYLVGNNILAHWGTDSGNRAAMILAQRIERAD
ncbi:hypothetical protein [Malonomonas rubra]|uniref:hypothetical protein n=1 Tax=Malonomonas rubra TaxID=57040 RepID=UPI0026F1DA75|nr:hypothetical protein [Malonomonas rubra]